MVLPEEGQDKYWCYVDSVLYKTRNCKEQDVGPFRGGDVLTAAVKTCETLGYIHQCLSDGAKYPCDAENEIPARIVGLFTEGMSFYMKYGFLPFLEGENMNVMKDIYCDAASKAKKVTVEQALADKCKNQEVPGYNLPGFEVTEFTKEEWNEATGMFTDQCPLAGSLGECYTKLRHEAVKQRKKHKDVSDLCRAINMTVRLMHPGEIPESLMSEALQNMLPSNDDCPHKDKNGYLARTSGLLVRSTKGVKVTHSKRDFTMLPERGSNNIYLYCATDFPIPFVPLKGQCLVKDMCMSNVLCENGKCCLQDGETATDQQECCSGKRAQRKCKAS